MVKDGVKRRIMVNKEVIVSAGTVNSPQLLMLSGLLEIFIIEIYSS
jgi:choline dehydrogenase-like flavoprotein